jgi:hypothetical protein
MDARFSHHYKNHHTCKNKWTLYWLNSHRIKNYTNITIMNEDYWVISTQNMSYLDFA